MNMSLDNMVTAVQTVSQACDNANVSGRSPRKSAAFITPIGFGQWASGNGNTTPARGIPFAALRRLSPARPPVPTGKRPVIRNVIMAHAKNPSIENCINLFGEHPEDVIAPISSASEALFWLEEICKTIAHEPIDPTNPLTPATQAEPNAWHARGRISPPVSGSSPRTNMKP
jgi:hypothetical protein